ncbi:MAG TPA: hypothetical protein VHS06_06885 [Chloroflexota bacterium]|nr:hypothetical protein [Chloroflexota bacterium]
MIDAVGSTLHWELAAWVGLAILAVQFVGLVFWVMLGSRGRVDVGTGHSLQLEAERRAEALLQEVLPEEQNRDLDSRGYLEVPSPSRQNRVYRVPRGRGMVSVYEDGRAIMSLCVQPVEWVPGADVVLMHKLMIEGNEEDYLRIANQFEPGYPYYLRWDRRTGRPA